MRARSRIVCYVAPMHSAPESEFARILTGIQERTGLSHQRIADAAGVDRSQVWRWVRTGSNPGYEPVRRLAAWLIAERPEVADAAASLLPAAGYETPPGPRPVLAPTAALPLGLEETARAYGADPADPNNPLIRAVRREVERAEDAYGEGVTGIQIFHGQAAAEIEAMIWDDPGVAREGKIVAIAMLRGSRAQREASRSGGSRPAAGLAHRLTLASR